MVAIKHIKVTHSLLSRPQYFSCGGNNGETNFLGLEPMPATSELAIFSGFCLQETKNSFPLLFSIRCAMLEKQGGTD